MESHEKGTGAEWIEQFPNPPNKGELKEQARKAKSKAGDANHTSFRDSSGDIDSTASKELRERGVDHRAPMIQASFEIHNAAGLEAFTNMDNAHAKIRTLPTLQSNDIVLNMLPQSPLSGLLHSLG